MTIRVFLVDDHALVRTGLRMILSAEPDIEVIGEAEDGEGALRQLRILKADVILCDLHLPGISGLEVTDRIVGEGLSGRVLIVSVLEDGPLPKRLLDVGAFGYIGKAGDARELLDTALTDDSGGDRAVRPQVHVTVEAEWLSQQPGADPPTLQGYGAIGPDLYSYLACGGDHTTILTHGTTGGTTPYAAVLNVGRTRRLATRAQRTAVRVQQDGHCAAPGCRHTHLELHHVSWWDRDGGRTDLVNLVGLCRACHLAVHAGRLGVEHDGAGGFAFRRLQGPSRRAVEDRDRLHRHRFRDYLRALGVARDGALDPASSQQLAAPYGSLERHRARHTSTPRT